jgi:hypothetical protein
MFLPQAFNITSSLSVKSLPNIIGVIKSRNMRWVGHVAVRSKTRNAYRNLDEKSEIKRQIRRT